MLIFKSFFFRTFHLLKSTEKSLQCCFLQTAIHMESFPRIFPSHHVKVCWFSAYPYDHFQLHPLDFLHTVDPKLICLFIYCGAGDTNRVQQHKITVHRIYLKIFLSFSLLLYDMKKKKFINFTK